MCDPPRKLTFNEVLTSSRPFYNDTDLETRFNTFIQNRANEIIAYDEAIRDEEITTAQVVNFLRNAPNGLKRILGQLFLSEEKFKRIITLIRKLNNTFNTEWSINRIDNEIRNNNDFADRLANIFINGKDNPQLTEHLPLFYRQRLHLTSLTESYDTREQLEIKLKDQYMGTYTNWKGDLIESLIRTEIEKTGVTFSAGLTAFVDVTVDWAIPNLENPYVIIMSSYQETTSSGQSTKTRDMIRCYEAIQHNNLQRGENRAFINFVDGGGWLARQRDLRRLVDGCHYFLNINNLDMLEAIIVQHVPDRYIHRQDRLNNH